MTHVSTTSPLSAPDIAAAVERRRSGYSLEAPFYTSREVFDLDLEAVFSKHWLFATTEAEIPEPGDYVTVDVGPRSVIVVRDDDEGVRAFRNVCRHRGSRLLSDSCGSVGNIVCPYHQWTYRVDGSLVFAESQDDSFDPTQFGLRSVHVRTVGGLIFLSLADEPPSDFDEFAEYVEPYLAPYELASAQVAHQTEIVEAGNWKLVMENNRECHHCDVAHPELLDSYFPFNATDEADVPPRMHALFERFQAANAALEATLAGAQFPQEPRRDLDSRPTGFRIDHLPLDGFGASFGPGGAPLCQKLMGSITDANFGDLYLHLQPNAWFHFLSDHAVLFRVLPVGPGTSVLQTTWLVNHDAYEGVDYETDKLTEVWQATNDEDRQLIEGTQLGVADPGYEPGPYASGERDVEAFATWYIQRLQAHLSIPSA